MSDDDHMTKTVIAVLFGSGENDDNAGDVMRMVKGKMFSQATGMLGM